MKLDTDTFGGFSNSICTWSTLTSASAILTFFHMHSVRKISPNSRRSLRKTLSCDISVHGCIGAYTINSSSYAINYSCHSCNDLLLLFRAVGRPHAHSKAKGVFVFIIAIRFLLNHSPSEWFSVYKRRRRHIRLRRFGRGRRLRTLGLRFWRPSLYQLSYSPICHDIIFGGPSGT